jgi:thiosulfate/3-mercaptopyruvate sulfurtransferase
LTRGPATSRAPSARPPHRTWAADGRFLPPGELRRRFEALGITDDVEVGVYCGSGVTAAHEVAALELAGFRAALYPGVLLGMVQQPPAAGG